MRFASIKKTQEKKAATIASLGAIFEVAPIVHMWLGLDEASEPALELL